MSSITGPSEKSVVLAPTTEEETKKVFKDCVKIAKKAKRKMEEIDFCKTTEKFQKLYSLYNADVTELLTKFNAIQQIIGSPLPEKYDSLKRKLEGYANITKVNTLDETGTGTTAHFINQETVKKIPTIWHLVKASSDNALHDMAPGKSELDFTTIGTNDFKKIINFINDYAILEITSLEMCVRIYNAAKFLDLSDSLLLKKCIDYANNNLTLKDCTEELCNLPGFGELARALSTRTMDNITTSHMSSPLLKEEYRRIAPYITFLDYSKYCMFMSLETLVEGEKNMV